MPGGLSSLLAGFLLAGPAGPTVDLEWEAPPQCPARADVVDELGKFLEAPDGSPATRVERVRARIEEHEGKWTLHLRAEVQGGVLERSLEAEDCEVLGSATALMISVLVHPAAILDRLERDAVSTEPETEPVPQSPPEPVPQSPPEADPVGRKVSRWRAAVRAEGGMSFGELPGAAGTSGLSIAALGPHVRLEVYGAYAWPKVGYPDPTVAAGAQVDGLWAGLRGCYVVGTKRVRVPLCVGGEAGRLRARGVGVERNSRPRAPWAAVLAGPRLEVRATEWLALLASVDGRVALTRPQFGIAGLGRAHLATLGGVRALLGLEVQFGSRGAQQPPAAAKTPVAPPGASAP